MRTLVLLGALGLAACGTRAASPGAGATPTYQPHTRAVTITTVPLLVKELAKTYPFLAKDFAKGGVLEGKEVYAFSPSTITAVAGDTLKLSLINPEDDDHSFVLHDLFVKIPPQGRIDTTYVVKAPGIYDFVCSVPSHLPMMHGELVVLAPSAVAGGAAR
ncbi:MAG TPA: cupredoxin domain-containing protein [Gemmatimonadaceae bacterium]|nr:cupredoxin domain-containing protein [Gemmatimonadaceae bacterium]